METSRLLVSGLGFWWLLDVGWAGHLHHHVALAAYMYDARLHASLLVYVCHVYACIAAERAMQCMLTHHTHIENF